MDDGSERVRVSDLKRFVNDCFCAIGVRKSHAEIMAESLVDADLTGHRSHGLFRLDRFIADGYFGSLDVNGEPVIQKETCATAWVDGRNTLGAVVGTYCMKVAIEKARKVGAAIVVANNSNNFGVAGFYSKQALKDGMVAYVLSNASALMLPTRGRYPFAGTNPLSLAAPGSAGDFFLFDMASTITSGGNIEIRYKNGEYLPKGYAVNAACLPETNADVALKTGRFLPLGSVEELGSYKGSNLSFMIDILCGVLGGAHYSQMVGVWLNRRPRHKANVGHCFIVINPKYFAPGFESRNSEFLNAVRNSEPLHPGNRIRIAGDRGRDMAKSVNQIGGIWYPKYVIDSIKLLVSTLKVKPVPFIPKPKKVELTPSEELSARIEKERSSSAFEESSVNTDRLSFVDTGSLLKEDISFVYADPSEWMCPLTEKRSSSYESLRQKRNKVSQDSFSKMKNASIHTARDKFFRPESDNISATSYNDGQQLIQGSIDEKTQDVESIDKLKTIESISKETELNERNFKVTTNPEENEIIDESIELQKTGNHGEDELSELLMIANKGELRN